MFVCVVEFVVEGFDEGFERFVAFDEDCDDFCFIVVFAEVPCFFKREFNEGHTFSLAS